MGSDNCSFSKLLVLENNSRIQSVLCKLRVPEKLLVIGTSLAYDYTAFVDITGNPGQGTDDRMVSLGLRRCLVQKCGFPSNHVVLRRPHGSLTK